MRPAARALGDVQTPAWLAEAVLRRLVARGLRPQRILEPTCGAGAFLRAARTAFGDAPRLVGVELQERYREDLADVAAFAALRFGDAAELDLAALLREAGDGEALVVGNLPWVTTDALARGAGGPGPRRTNPKGLRGLDALTGDSAFDVAEYLALRLFAALAEMPRATFAMLLKESVARRLLRELRRRATPVRFAAVARIDARHAFGVAADACLLELDFGHDGETLREVSVAPSLNASPDETWYVGDGVVAREPSLRRTVSALVWRQGLKHDAAALFELRRDDDGTLRNGLGEAVAVEDDAVYPFVRARDLARGAGHDGRSYVLVPYRTLRGSEDELAARAPRLHAYLRGHGAAIDARRSAVYRSAPRFALFGIGPYAFAPYKVAVSGLHRAPRFVVLGGERPVQLADTAYALAFEDETDARLVARLLGSAPVLDALRSAVFAGKRPITKRLLSQLDLPAAVASAPEADRPRLRELLQDAD